MVSMVAIHAQKMVEVPRHRIKSMKGIHIRNELWRWIDLPININSINKNYFLSYVEIRLYSDNEELICE